jgi:hypothetical protein
MNHITPSAIPKHEEDFRMMVVEKLSRLETLLNDLAGNGRPGRIHRLEEKVRLHDRILWMTAGAGLLAGWLLRQIFH